jgi:Transposase DDE domain group 1
MVKLAYRLATWQPLLPSFPPTFSLCSLIPWARARSSPTSPQYLDLDADRTSTHWMASNQLVQGTELAQATAGTIRQLRQRLLKVGAMVTVSTRRVYIRLASAFPLQHVFAQAHRALVGLVPEEG